MSDEVMAAALKASLEARDALHAADKAQSSISTHEQVCAQRYENIQDKLKGIPRLFEKMDKISMLVYIGMGIMISVVSVIEFLRYLGK